ncbi:MAG TPA: TIGR03936 family radical SAM-associated protein, partial [Chloroflexota bacterium]|nr:TIGR03936 family radical SAM-associated protein [Chloroflexota bacterium]
MTANDLHDRDDLTPATPPAPGGDAPAPPAPPAQASHTVEGVPSGFGPSGRSGRPPVLRMRLVFAKRPSVRFIGHLDLVRLWERACRRAQLPLAYTLGFTPHPRLTFASPLALGATGDRELLDIYFTEAIT